MTICFTSCQNSSLDFVKAQLLSDLLPCLEILNSLPRHVFDNFAIGFRTTLNLLQSFVLEEHPYVFAQTLSSSFGRNPIYASARLAFFFSNVCALNSIKFNILVLLYSAVHYFKAIQHNLTAVLIFSAPVSHLPDKSKLEILSYI
ncbi:hypothetical protein Tco_0332018 [Tanacetum coccineum]